jgi:hypothetical protein
LGAACPPELVKIALMGFHTVVVVNNDAVNMLDQREVAGSFVREVKSQAAAGSEEVVIVGSDRHQTAILAQAMVPVHDSVPAVYVLHQGHMVDLNSRTGRALNKETRRHLLDQAEAQLARARAELE